MSYSVYFEHRIGQASELLFECSISKKKICYQSRFNEITSFNKQFKSITNLSPKSNQKLYRGNNYVIRNNATHI